MTIRVRFVRQQHEAENALLIGNPCLASLRDASDHMRREPGVDLIIQRLDSPPRRAPLASDRCR